MIIDSHMHLIDTGCFDKPTYDALGQSIPADSNSRMIELFSEGMLCSSSTARSHNAECPVMVP